MNLGNPPFFFLRYVFPQVSTDARWRKTKHCGELINEAHPRFFGRVVVHGKWDMGYGNP
jgi:hypothetical protein